MEQNHTPKVRIRVYVVACIILEGVPFLLVDTGSHEGQEQAD